MKKFLVILGLMVGCTSAPINQESEFVEIVSSDHILHINQESDRCRNTQNTHLEFITNVTPGYINNRIEWETHVLFNNVILPSEAYLGSQVGPSVPVLTSPKHYSVYLGFGPYPFVPETLYLRQNNTRVNVLIELCNMHRCIRSPQLAMTINVNDYGHCYPSTDNELPDPGNY